MDISIKNQNILKNKIFISTRPLGKSAELECQLKAHGAILLEMPMIEIVPNSLTEEEEKLLLDVSRFQWIVFTSANGIAHFFKLLKKLTGSFALSKKIRIAVIGEKSAFELQHYNQTAHYINRGSTSEEFSFELEQILGDGKPNVLLPLGNLAGDVIENKLKPIAHVTRIHVYRTEMPESVSKETLNLILNDKYEMIIFTSPSGFTNFHSLAKDRMDC
jgi:uroporphyrinogen-III synthase